MSCVIVSDPFFSGSYYSLLFPSILLLHILGHVPTCVLYIAGKFSAMLILFFGISNTSSILPWHRQHSFFVFSRSLLQFCLSLGASLVSPSMSPHAEFIKTQSRKSKPFTSASAFPLRTRSCVFLFFMLQISLNRCFLLLLFSIFLFLNDKGSFKTRCLSKERVVEDIPFGLSHCPPDVVRIFFSDYKM